MAMRSLNINSCCQTCIGHSSSYSSSVFSLESSRQSSFRCFRSSQCHFGWRLALLFVFSHSLSRSSIHVFEWRYDDGSIGCTLLSKKFPLGIGVFHCSSIGRLRSGQAFCPFDNDSMLKSLIFEFGDRATSTEMGRKGGNWYQIQ